MLQKYSRPIIVLHWLSALLIIALWAVGKVMVGNGSTLLYRLHTGVGMVLLLLTILRLVMLWRSPKVEALPDMSKGRERAFHWNHWLLYGTLLALGGSGIGMLLASGMSPAPPTVDPAKMVDSPPRNAHGLLSLVLLGLIVMHVVGVLHYQRKHGRTLGRMGIGPRR